MTAYHGGKQRLGKAISHSILETCKDLDFDPEYYCEPFVGMCGVASHIPGLFPRKKMLAGDINESLILMWKQAMNGWVPPESFSKDEYEELKQQSPCALRGFVGHAYSFGGLFFGCYRDDYYSDGRQPGSVRSSKRVSEIASSLKGICSFTTGDYTQFSNLKNSIIYCDPPYKKCSKYYKDTPDHTLLTFDHEAFWKWCVKMSRNNNLVFVSEYESPSNLCQEVFTKSTTSTYSAHSSKNTERLYLVL